MFCGSIVYAGNGLKNTHCEVTFSNTKRILYLDLLRIVSAFTVVFLHVNTTSMNTVPINSYRYAVFNAFAMLSRFCVPVFLMISGVFFLEPSHTMTFKKLFCHNIKRIVSAFLFWSFIHAVYMLVSRCLYTNKKMTFDLVDFMRMCVTGEYGYSHLQFMFYLVGGYLLVPFMRKIAEKKEYVLYYLTLSVLFGFGATTMQQFAYGGKEILSFYQQFLKFLRKFDISFVCGYTGYFFAGYYLHKYDLSYRHKVTLYCCAILAVIMTVYLSIAQSLEINSIYTRLFNYKGLPVFLESCGVFLLFKQCFGNVRFRTKICETISNIAVLTFGVYLCHYMILLELSRHGMNHHLFNPLLSVPFFTCVIFLLSLTLIWLLRKISFMKLFS